MSRANSSLAVFASRSDGSRGRRVAEPDSPTRTCFQRDRDRIIHSAAFRRLKYKTQVFVYHEGDNFRTRLTHSLEVAQIARSISRSLGLDEDLAEALSLAHDLGHTPFGHAGESALDKAMAAHGGFDHNEQTLRVLTALEQRYADFDGLNLTWETLEGTVKHNGPLLPRRPEAGPLPATIAAVDRALALRLDGHPGPEAQVAALSDDIAYNNHDIDDGLRAGLFTIADLGDIPLVGPIFRDVQDCYPGLETSRLIHEAVRRLITAMVDDLLAETRRRIAAARPRSADEVRAHRKPLVAFSEAMRQNDRALRDFLFARMYRHHRVNRMTGKAKRVVRELFEHYLEAPNCLPEEWRAQAERSGPDGTARLVADYIAGMTDRYALKEHRKLFDPYL